MRCLKVTMANTVFSPCQKRIKRPGGRAGMATPLQYSFLENPMDRRARWATVHEVAKSQID